MSWLDERTIDLGCGQKVTPFWHCFGVKDEIVRLSEALEMLRVSKTALLPLNCHRLAHGPLIGHDPWVTWQRFRPLVHTQIPCLNINLQTSADAAVEIAEHAFRLTGIDLLKLEVLTEDLKESNDEAVLEATIRLVDRDFRVMPLISANLAVAEDLPCAPHVPALRVMGSPIGSGLGIEKPSTIYKICRLKFPVILDGGISCAKDVRDAMELGCAGFLVNSCLFRDNKPVEALRQLRRSLERDPQPKHQTDAELWHEWFESRYAAKH